ncbi:MAG: zinc-finger domain-containing protein [Proteobacteria bacterium]|nr:zinc-finger domain-containing protein [Pseudomonadota bacterium]
MTLKHPEIIQVPKDRQQVSCDDGGALGHPKVYYTFDGEDEVTCGYCNRLFTKKPTAGATPLKGAA